MFCCSHSWSRSLLSAASEMQTRCRCGPFSLGRPLVQNCVSQIGPSSCHIINSESGAGKFGKRHFHGKTWTRSTQVSQIRSQQFFVKSRNLCFTSDSWMQFPNNRSQILPGKRFRVNRFAPKTFFTKRMKSTCSSLATRFHENVEQVRVCLRRKCCAKSFFTEKEYTRRQSESYRTEPYPTVETKVVQTCCT